MNDVRKSIGWCDFTWNVAPGCLRGCSYCWARAACRRQKHRCQQCYEFVPHFHAERLDEPRRRKKPARIGVSLTGDIVGRGAHGAWLTRIVDVVRDCPQHTFLFLTHRPQALPHCGWPPNAWVGVTANTGDEIEHAVECLRNVQAPVRFLSIEPMLGRCGTGLWPYVDWIIVGGQTGAKKFTPPREWVDELVDDARGYQIAVYCKDNVGFDGPKEFPAVRLTGPLAPTRIAARPDADLLAAGFTPASVSGGYCDGGLR